METEDEMDGIESAMDDLTKSPGQVLDEFSVVDPFLDETSDQEQEEISNDAVEITDDALNIPNDPANQRRQLMNRLCQMTSL